MKHFTTPEFWEHYGELPETVRTVADRQFDRMKADPYHPSLHFKRVGRYVSARVGRSFRALGILTDDSIIWFWIGSHADYDRIVG